MVHGFCSCPSWDQQPAWIVENVLKSKIKITLTKTLTYKQLEGNSMVSSSKLKLKFKIKLNLETGLSACFSATDPKWGIGLTHLNVKVILPQ